MSEDRSPWRNGPPAEPPPPRGGLWLWIVLIAAVIGLVVALVRAFPGAVSGREGWASLIYMLGFVGLLSAGLVRAGRLDLRRHLRDAAVWTVIVAVLALGVAYRDVAEDAVRRVRLAFSGGDAVPMGEGEVAVPRDAGGAYMIMGAVNGRRARFMVDTGASDVVLSPADAERIGVNLATLRFDRQAETANGVGYGAAYVIDRLEIGPIGFDDVPVVINQTPMSSSLLGMSFLHRLESFEFRDGKLFLRWRPPAP